MGEIDNINRLKGTAVSEDNRPENTPTVSIIIPVYNVAPFLREALDSVVNQTYKVLQILIIDDGSTDGSSQICDEYKKDPRITVIHQENRGVSAARNAGLDAATGQYISWLDPDDAYDLSFIEKLISGINNADIALCRYSVQRTDGSLVSSRKKRGLRGLGTGPRAKEGTYGREDSLRMLVNGAINCSVWNKLFHAELWRTIRFPDGHDFEDIDTMHHIFDLCKNVTVIDQVLYYYRIRPGSITHRVSRKTIDDRERALSRLEKFVRAHVPEIFSEEHVQRIRSRILEDMIENYAHLSSDDEVQREDLRKEVLAAGRQIGVKNCAMRCRTHFFIIKYCPWLLKSAFSIYSSLRRTVFIIIGR